MKNLLLLFAAFVVLVSGCSQPAETGFVKVVNGRFEIDGNPYYYIGTNFWYGAILGSQGVGGDRERLLRELDFMQASGIDNLRILVGADGADGVPTKVEPALQTAPGEYNDTLFDGLDFLLSEMGKRGMRAVLYLNNSWEWSGGYSVYLKWSGHGEIPMPAQAGWDAFREYVAQYAKATEAHKLFENHIRNVVGRTNRYTGQKYADDPTLMSWQIANEPRPFGVENHEAFARWIASAAAVIRSLDPNHLISIGMEGLAGVDEDSETYLRIHSDPNIDYLTMHIWPYNWSWIAPDDMAATLPQAIDKTLRYMDTHIGFARKLGKPIVLEEFGMPRDDMSLAEGTTTDARDTYYAAIFEAVADNARRQGALQGCNFWAWGGDARPFHASWQSGDPYMGDPAQEAQGLNSVYDTDSTVVLITRYTSILDKETKK